MPRFDPIPVDAGDDIINTGEETVDTATPVENTKVIEPKTRMEYFLNKIADAVNVEGGSSGSGGSGGGANVLTLYITGEDPSSSYTAFKDSSRTQTFETYEEAKNAVISADIIKIMVDHNFEYCPRIGLFVDIGSNSNGNAVKVMFGIPEDYGFYIARSYAILYDSGDEGGGEK